MSLVPSQRARWYVAIAVLALAATLAFTLIRSDAAPAEQNPSNMACRGHIEKGATDPDDPDTGVVEYVFACSQPITGYALLPERSVVDMETEVFATDPSTKQVIGTDAFGCTGDLPGFSVNCTGTYGGGWHVARGTFGVEGDICREPRVDPLLVVTYASVSGGKVTQYIAGPFDLGRPHGCPKSRKPTKLRIPREQEESTIAPVA